MKSETRIAEFVHIDDQDGSSLYRLSPPMDAKAVGHFGDGKLYETEFVRVKMVGLMVEVMRCVDKFGTGSSWYLSPGDDVGCIGSSGVREWFRRLGYAVVGENMETCVGRGV